MESEVRGDNVSLKGGSEAGIKEGVVDRGRKVGVRGKGRVRFQRWGKRMNRRLEG